MHERILQFISILIEAYCQRADHRRLKAVRWIGWLAFTRLPQAPEIMLAPELATVDFYTGLAHKNLPELLMQQPTCPTKQSG